ncbi:hypothetical protein THERMOT_1578 [Bathymodiolus thermophilus thioautotrophic gill symbiont]|nr:hypothetical protein THERMOT_1578 [Bathymodiolus thermophilus thioautotrophic gill symbiont]
MGNELTISRELSPNTGKKVINTSKPVGLLVSGIREKAKFNSLLE